MTSTFSRSHLVNCEGYPSFCQGDSASGSRLTLSGVDYIDWVQGLGDSGILGHLHPAVVSSVRSTLDEGTAVHIENYLESEVALRLMQLLPWAEDTRFCLNGTDALQGAVRLARAVTGRGPVITFKGAYHGDSADWAIQGKNPARGVASHGERIEVEWNDCDGLERQLSRRCAAVVFEVQDDPSTDLVSLLNSSYDRYGSVLIADEVVTGFRLGLTGACGRYSIRPTLACYGKALGGGFPIACLVGRRDLMREFDLGHTSFPVFMSYTNAGNMVGLSAAKAVLDTLTPSHFIYTKTIGRMVMDGLRDLAESILKVPWKMVGQPERFSLRFDLYHVFQYSMLQSHILVGVPWFPSIHHSVSEALRTLDCAEGALRMVSEGYPFNSPVKLFHRP